MVTHVNEPGNLGDDVFAYKLNYDVIEGQGGLTISPDFKPMYNGNVAQVTWQSASDLVKRDYKYSYDSFNRLKKASFSQSDYHLNQVTYDKGGNITALHRNLQNGFHNFQYQYEGNKVHSINGTQTINGQMMPVVRSYGYDVNGNMISDSSKGVDLIEYNYLSLPERVVFTNGNSIEYDYTASGVKLQKRFITNSQTVTTDYLHGFQYENGELLFFGQPEGYVVHTVATNGTETNQYVHNFTDHLGNVRISYTDLDGSGSIDLGGEIVKERNYYPFGLQHQGYNNVEFPLGSMFKYGFGGKELQEENSIGWMDFGARNYDAELGRWFNVDPQAERYHIMSPFAAMGNNPIMFVDPNGEELISAILIGAVIGAATAAVTYSLPALATGNWNIEAFGSSILTGAISGAISAGLSSGAAGLSASAIANGGSGAFWQSTSFNILSETASQVGTSLAVGNRISVGTVGGAIAGGIVGGNLPKWKGVEGGYLKNAMGEIGFNTSRGGIRGAFSGGVGAAIDGSNIGKGIKNGMINGAIGGASQTIGLIATFGATYNPSDDQLKYANNMASAFGLSTSDVAWRKGGLYQVLQPLWSQGYKREVTWGNTVATFRDTDSETFGHEYGHIIQNHMQGWGNFQGRGLFEQLFFRGNPYQTPGANEYEADRLLYKYGF